MDLENIRTTCPHCGRELHVDKEDGKEFFNSAKTLLISLIEEKVKFILFCDCFEAYPQIEGYVAEYLETKILFESIFISVDNKMIGFYSFYEKNNSELINASNLEAILSINNIFTWNNLEEATDIIKRLLKMAIFS